MYAVTVCTISTPMGLNSSDSRIGVADASTISGLPTYLLRLCARSRHSFCLALFAFSGALAKRSSFSLTVGGLKNCSSPCPSLSERVVDFGRVRRSQPGRTICIPAGVRSMLGISLLPLSAKRRSLKRPVSRTESGRSNANFNLSRSP